MYRGKNQRFLTWYMATPCTEAQVGLERWYMATPLFYYVYVLFSKKDNQFYIGSTEDLRKRIKKHQSGQINSTKNRLPVELVFFEGYLDKYDALRREDYLKTTKGKRTLRNMLQEFISKKKVFQNKEGGSPADQKKSQI